MKPKTINILYWIFTGLFAAFLFMDGTAGLVRAEGGKEAFAQMGYPEYLLDILGTAKILAGIALLQPRFILLKEWAYAGLTFNFLGASASWYFSGVPGFIFPPLVMLSFMLFTYWLWKKKLRSAQDR